MLKSPAPKLTSAIFAACCLLFSSALAMTSRASTNAAPVPTKITWKSEEMAQLNIEGHVPITWNVYTSEKHKNLALILLGHRYLALDLKTQTVYQLDLTQVTKNGTQIETDEPSAIGKLIPSTDWSQRDVGPAEHVVLTLQDYGRKIDLELPHLMDLRRGIY